MAAPVELQSRCGECLLYGAIQGMSDGVVLVDPSERIFHINRRAREILGLGSRHVLGTSIGAVRHPGLACCWSASLKEEVPVTTDLTFAGGALRVTISTCFSTTREPIGRMIILRDVTHEKRITLDLSATVARRLAEMPGGEPPSGPPADLTPREHEVLSSLLEGLTNVGIAARLNVSMNTLASHLKGVYAKLQVTRRDQA